MASSRKPLVSTFVIAAVAGAFACSHPDTGGTAGIAQGGSATTTSTDPSQGGSANTTNNGTGNTSTAPASGGSTLVEIIGNGGVPQGNGGANPNAGGANPSDGGAPTGVGSTASGGTPVVKTACVDNLNYKDDYIVPYTSTEQQAAHQAAVSAVSTMSATDKANQLRGTTWGSSTQQNWTDIFRSLNTSSVRGFTYRDGPRGVNLDAPIQSGATGGKSTAFPVAIARGAAFDLDLERRIGLAIGDESLAAGQTVMLAPTINILRHPAWGRAQETYGEDPYLLGRMGSAFVVGVQKYIPACAKHYAANNIENGRETANATMDEQTLREIYARHFEMVIKDSGVACIMAAYNLVNGTKCTQNAHLLTDILRGDFGFKGFTMTDWWALPGGSGAWKSDTNTLKSGASSALAAGLDLELPWGLYYGQLESLMTSSTTVSQQVTEAATRIVEQKKRFKVDAVSGAIGLQSPKTSYASPNITYNSAQQVHIDLAYEAALKSMVLLKNEKNTLPINKTAVKTIAVVGTTASFTVSDGANDMGGKVNFASLEADGIRTGDVGSSRVLFDAALGISPAKGIQAAATAAGVAFVSGSTAAAAQNADFVVVVAGLTAQDEGEEYTKAGDRATFALDGKANVGMQNQLIADVAALGKPMVVVLEGGSVIDVEPWLSKVPAIVMAWYPGMVGGKALGELLFGTKNFSGKLPLTWPVAYADEPPMSASAAMGYDVGYRWFDRNGKNVRFPFGHGLSYTTFEYRSATTACSDVTKNGIVEVKVDVYNTGTVEGTETVMLFATYPNTTARRPIKELKGFQRATIPAGAGARVTIPVRVADLKYWNSTTNAWAVETGNVVFQIGPNAAHLPLSVTVPVK